LANVYLASGFNRRLLLRTLARELSTTRGHAITSSWIWLDKRPERDTEEWEAFAGNIAATNLLDLFASDVLVVDTEGIMPDNNGGVHFETGFMYARNKEIWLVGERTNTFHWLHDINQVKDYEELLKCL
jgi:nucleoside 2-deoxyribosyltransferase